MHQGSYRRGTRGNAVFIVKVFKNVLLTALTQFSGDKCTRLQDFADAISKNFPGVIPGPS